MKDRILTRKWYLYLTEFFAGMSVMAVELGASRLLAPYFSSSQIVWTIIIGTIMIAMALGNLYGGKRADRSPDPAALYRRILIAAVWIAAIPFLGKYLILGISGVIILSVNTNYLIWAAFAACMLIFVFPLFLLGTVTPCLVKATMEGLEDNASIVGRLGAANTIGSIIGTFVPTFVTIPSVGTAVTFLIFAGILFALSLMFFMGRFREKGAGAGKDLAKTGAAGLLIVLCAVFGAGSSFAFWKEDLVYEGESIYNYLQVSEDDRSVILSTNVLFGVQSIYVKEDTLTGMYYDYALAAPFMTPAGVSLSDMGGEEPLKVLILGMGTGTYATQLKRFAPEARITGVEIDQGITDLAGTYFGLSEEVPVVTYDGRAYLNAVDETYDVIMVDAYQDITIPFQMASREFFTLVRDHLTPEGVMVVNMNLRGRTEGNINEYLADTIGSVFPEVLTVDVAGNTNRELFAGCGGDLTKRLSRGVEALKEGTPTPVALQLAAFLEQRVCPSLMPHEQGAYLMTDDKAPVELLSMRAIDAVIADEVAYYRGVYESEGLSGLLENL